MELGTRERDAIAITWPRSFMCVPPLGVLLGQGQGQGLGHSLRGREDEDEQGAAERRFRVAGGWLIAVRGIFEAVSAAMPPPSIAIPSVAAVGYENGDGDIRVDQHRDVDRVQDMDLVQDA